MEASTRLILVVAQTTTRQHFSNSFLLLPFANNHHTFTYPNTCFDAGKLAPP